MRFYRSLDILINIVVPILLGGLSYFINKASWYPLFLRDHLADGLWAYAFISAMLIIWGRSVHTIWILATFLIAVLFELFQGYHIIPGTGDVYDVLTYFAFFIIAIRFNPFFKFKFYT
jgi:hypothetical protein